MPGPPGTPARHVVRQACPPLAGNPPSPRGCEVAAIDAFGAGALHGRGPQFLPCPYFAGPLTICKESLVNDPSRVLQRLTDVISQRKAASVDTSYTAHLLKQGAAAIGGKIVEEAAEVVEAGAEPGAEGQAHLVRESADLVFHLMVMLAYRNVTMADVLKELARREGTSGLEEKASRS